MRIDMKTIPALVLVLYAGAAFAQGASPPAAVFRFFYAGPLLARAPPPPAAPPPTVGGKPLVQVKPRGATPTPAAAGKNLPIAKRLQACLEIEDGSKGRLDCYDAIFPPKPNPKAAVAKGGADCRFTQGEEEGVTC